MQTREKYGKGKKSERKGPKNKNKKRERVKEKKGEGKKIKKKIRVHAARRGMYSSEHCAARLLITRRVVRIRNTGRNRVPLSPKWRLAHAARVRIFIFVSANAVCTRKCGWACRRACFRLFRAPHATAQWGVPATAQTRAQFETVKQEWRSGTHHYQ